jgi:hypothetical protein
MLKKAGLSAEYYSDFETKELIGCLILFQNVSPYNHIPDRGISKEKEY